MNCTILTCFFVKHNNLRSTVLEELQFPSTPTRTSTPSNALRNIRTTSHVPSRRRFQICFNTTPNYLRQIFLLDKTRNEIPPCVCHPFGVVPFSDVPIIGMHIHCYAIEDETGVFIDRKANGARV